MRRTAANLRGVAGEGKKGRRELRHIVVVVYEAVESVYICCQSYIAEGWWAHRRTIKLKTSFQALRAPNLKLWYEVVNCGVVEDFETGCHILIAFQVQFWYANEVKESHFKIMTIKWKWHWTEDFNGVFM